MSDFTGPGVYYIQCVETKTVVNLAGNNRADGTNVIGWDYVSTDNELWVLANAGNDEYLVLSVATGTYMTAPSNGSGQVTGYLISPTKPSVRWKIVPVGNGSGAYIFKSVANGNNLNLSGANKENGTPIIIYKPSDGAKNEQWYIKLQSSA